MEVRSAKNLLLPGILSLGLLVGCGGNLTTNAGSGSQAPTSTQQETSSKQVSQPISDNNDKNNGSSSGSAAVSLPGNSSATSGTMNIEIHQPSSIAFWDTQQGLMVATSNGHGVVWRTTDGGHHWAKVYENANPLSRVVVTGAASAKVLVGDNWTNPSAQIITANNGQTWQQQSYTKPSFADQACSVGQFGEDLFVNHSAPSTAEMWALCDGNPGAGQMPKMIVTSTDGGKTWTKQAEENPNSASSDGLGLSGYPQGIDFLANGRGWLWESRGNSFYTIDGGRHWTPFTNLTSPESKEARSMSLIDNQHGYALLWDDNRYRLMFTADGGQSWVEVQSWMNQ